MTESIYKIVIISHVFTRVNTRKRWEMLADSHKNLDITLISPKKWQYGGTGAMTTGGSEILICEKSDRDNYHIIPVEYSIDRTGSWISNEMLDEIVNIHPDLVYHVGTHLQTSLFSCLKLAKKKLPNTKFVTFSMRGPNWNLLYNWKVHPFKKTAKFLYFYPKLCLVNKYSDAIICHYPDAIDSFRSEGYKGPIYMSTQIGVDTDIYRPNADFREKIRAKYNLGNSWVFGSATRFTPDKGLDDIIDALPQKGDWKYLMIGGGRDIDKKNIIAHIKERGLEDKVIMTGHIGQNDMPQYWNAIDCALHTPRTAEWVETFSVALVQAMETGLPVVGSDSGSVPYQLGEDALIVKERNITELNEKIVWILNHPDKAKIIGSKLKWRAEHCFSIKHLNDCIYDIFIDIINGVFDENKVDQAKYKVPEYNE